jgi:hypothetical protein
MMVSSTERKRDEAAKLQFILTGFAQTAGIRIYTFEGMVDGVRILRKVEVDLALIPGYGIRIQDLPLLCRELLQRRVEPDAISLCVFTEQEMRIHADKIAMAREEAGQRKKPPRHPVSPNPGAAWRTTFR